MIAVVVLLPVLLLGNGSFISDAEADDPTPDNPACDQFYAYDGENGNFGPALTGDAESMHSQLQQRRTHDCLLAAAHLVYVSGQMPNTTDEQVHALARDFASHPDHYARALRTIEEAEAGCEPVQSTRSGNYETLAMRRGDSPSTMPSIYKVSITRGSFDVLVLDCGGGRKFVYKIDCGGQVVVQRGTIPGIPTTPRNPNLPPPPGPPPTCPGCNPPPTTQPPPPTTVPPCPPGYECKDPDDSVQNGNGPAQGNGDTGNGTPDTPDTQVPTPTVPPPANPPPPPSATIPPQPPADPYTPPPNQGGGDDVPA